MELLITKFKRMKNWFIGKGRDKVSGMDKIRKANATHGLQLSTKVRSNHPHRRHHYINHAYKYPEGTIGFIITGEQKNNQLVDTLYIKEKTGGFYAAPIWPIRLMRTQFDQSVQNFASRLDLPLK